MNRSFVCVQHDVRVPRRLAEAQAPLVASHGHRDGCSVRVRVTTVTGGTRSDRDSDSAACQCQWQAPDSDSEARAPGRPGAVHCPRPHAVHRAVTVATGPAARAPGRLWSFKLAP